MKDFYDVIIIGAGPAGLSCAKELQNASLDVLVLEKNKEIGPKVCAGGLTIHTLKELELPEGSMEIQQNYFILRSIFQKVIVKYEKNFIFTFERKKLAQWQLSKINSSDITIETGSELTAIEKNQITVNGSKIKYRFLVGADGSNSQVRKYLGVRSEKVGIAMHYVLPASDKFSWELTYNPKYFHSWYGWVFPHENYVSVGCGGDPQKISAPRLKKNFEKWLIRRGIDIGNARFEAHAMNHDYRGYNFGNVFLAGDAAGRLSCLTGEGVYQAIISGREIARLIKNPAYRSEEMPKIINMLRMHEKIVHLQNSSRILRVIGGELAVALMRSGWGSRILLKRGHMI